jgi:hypothetical protein
MMLSDALKVLTTEYLAATGSSLSGLSLAAGQHEKFFFRVMDGEGVQLRKAEEALKWFSAHWPCELSWPAGIVRPQVESAEEIAIE